MVAIIDYGSAGPLTELAGVDDEVLANLGSDPIELCMPAHSLVIQPRDAESIALPQERFDTNQVRPASALVAALLQLDSSSLSVPRDPDKRIVGTCRHFAVISCALLRNRGIPSRVRCGFATYFQAGQGLDHWITEYWSSDDSRWVRVDSEIIGGDVLGHPEDLRPGEFLTGGEAWSSFRRGDIDATTFGVYGTENWGVAEIRGNAVKDLAALNMIEMLPWDEWGRMTDAYNGVTGPEYDDLLDEVSAVCAADDPRGVSELYQHADLRVPADLIQ
jgi:hypothetical protein